MKNAIMGWLVARFAENTSKTGLGFAIAGSWDLYQLLSSTPPPNGNAIAAPAIVVLLGLVAFVTHDSLILKGLKLPDKSQ